QGGGAGPPLEPHQRGRAATGPAVGARLGLELGDELLVDEIGGDGGDAGVAEPGARCQGGARLRPLHTQGAQNESPVLTPDTVAIADLPRQATHSTLAVNTPFLLP